MIDTFRQNELNEILSSFSCPQNLDVEDFLVNPNKAIRFETTENSRTYIILDDETANILGYFSLTFKEITLENKKISKTEIKNLDGISKNANRIKAFLIGQIGKNKAINNNDLNLQLILDDIYTVISKVQSLIGGRVIFLECENISRLIKLYETHGFKLLETEDPDCTQLKTMYINIAQK
jgi:hypothetical protein